MKTKTISEDNEEEIVLGRTTDEVSIDEVEEVMTNIKKVKASEQKAEIIKFLGDKGK